MYMNSAVSGPTIQSAFKSIFDRVQFLAWFWNYWQRSESLENDFQQFLLCKVRKIKRAILWSIIRRERKREIDSKPEATSFCGIWKFSNWQHKVAEYYFCSKAGKVFSHNFFERAFRRRSIMKSTLFTSAVVLVVPRTETSSLFQ